MGLGCLGVYRVVQTLQGRLYSSSAALNKLEATTGILHITCILGTEIIPDVSITYMHSLDVVVPFTFYNRGACTGVRSRQLQPLSDAVTGDNACL